MRLAPGRLKTALSLSITALFLVWIAWWLLWRPREMIDTVVVEHGDIELSISAMGTLQPRHYVDVGAQASGEIRRITVQPGTKIKKGELLVEIDPAVQQAKVDTDRASFENLKAQLSEQQANAELAQQQMARQQRMQDEGSTREEDVQLARNALQVAKARIASLHAQLAGAASTLKGNLAQLGYTRIFAPMSGTVITLDALEGQTLNATYQTPKIMRIADLGAMTVWTQVSEADIRHIRDGMPAWFSTLGNERHWQGRVRQILPAPPTSANQELAETGKALAAPGKVVFYTVLVDVDNDDGALRPQMSAQVYFVDQAAKAALLAPLSALQAIAGEANLYRAQVLQADGAVIDRQVHTGINDRLRVQVLAGLAQGEKLVLRRRSVRPIDGRLRW